MTKEELFLKVTKGKLCTDEKNYIPKKKKQGIVTQVNNNSRVITVNRSK